MNPYRKAALLLIRLIAFGCIIFSMLQFGLYFLAKKTGNKVNESAPMLALKAVPFVVGFGLLLKGNAIARRLTEDFDE